jgi:ATP/maltotriose-dependent transcriptional regulator MalT
LKLIARGYSDRQIAEELNVWFFTAKMMARLLAAKLGVQSRSQLIEESRKLT